MYDRIVLTPSESSFPDGSLSIPSSLLFSAVTQYNESVSNVPMLNSQIINAKSSRNLVAYNTKANSLNIGTLTNNTFEFIIDFPKFESGYYNADGTIAKLYKEFEGSNAAIRINKSYLTDNLSCIEIPDYSFQAMTMKNYDYFIKIFDKDDNKLPNSFIIVLKSYTMKKAWIFYFNVFKSNSASNPNDGVKKVIIDFRYKNSNNFNNKLNEYANIQDYFNILSRRSPYYDKYYISSSNKQKVLVNRQSQYFTNDMNNIFNKTVFNERALNNINVEKETMRDSSAENISASFDMRYYSYSQSLSNCNAVDYEIYYYSSKNSSKGIRCLTNSDISNKKSGYFEVFPIGRGLVHYIFTNTNGKNISLSQLKVWMRDNKIYLYNSNFDNVNNIRTSFVEAYIPIQISPYLTAIEPELSSGEENANLSIPSNIYLGDNYSISKYDPSNLYFNTGYDNGNEYAEPYLESDIFVNSILEDGEIRIKDFNTDNKKDVFAWRNLKSGDLLNYDFDILTLASPTVSTSKLTLESVKEKLETSKFRVGIENNIVSQIEQNISQLSNNLKNFIPNANTNTTQTINVSPTNNFFFVYFYDDADYVNISLTFNKINNYTNVKMNYILKPISDNLYIFPCIRCDTEDYNYTINFPKSVNIVF